jgi:hypothetical protein
VGGFGSAFEIFMSLSFRLMSSSFFVRLVLVACLLPLALRAQSSCSIQGEIKPSALAFKSLGGTATLCGYNEFEGFVSTPPRKYSLRAYSKHLNRKVWDVGSGYACQDPVVGPGALSYSFTFENTDYYPFGQIIAEVTFSISYGCASATDSSVKATITLTSATATLHPAEWTGEAPREVTGVQAGFGGLNLTVGASGNIVSGNPANCFAPGARVYFGNWNYPVSYTPDTSLCFGGRTPAVAFEHIEVEQAYNVAACVQGAPAGVRSWGSEAPCMPPSTHTENYATINESMPAVSAIMRRTDSAKNCEQSCCPFVTTT